MQDPGDVPDLASDFPPLALSPPGFPDELLQRLKQLADGRDVRHSESSMLLGGSRSFRCSSFHFRIASSRSRIFCSTPRPVGS